MLKKDFNIDAKLVNDFKKGDTKALNQLVKRWHKTFCKKAYWLVKDADVAKDIAQDSWSTIINKINQLEQPQRFASWSLRVVCNKSIDWLNKEKKKQKYVAYKTSEEIVTEIEYQDANQKSQITKELWKAFNLLPVHQQMVLQLFYRDGYSLKEVSKTLNISVGTAKSRLFHGREKLKQLLKHYNYET
ncbi:hypothetical protein MHTCC0001_04200 [Flavobacteriaceae bacterium MHTCC 0001]